VTFPDVRTSRRVLAPWRSGVSIERRDAMVCQVRDGQIVRLDYYNNPDEALKAVGIEG